MTNQINNNNFNNLEILAPAGSPECFFADINAGADAVYLGLSNFNARMKAENFTAENIREYVKKAHLLGVKVYVTLNTLVTDDDFQDLIELVKVLVEAKVDAYIVQDLGVAYILKHSFDNIVLHASTQLGIHNLYGAKIAEKIGFSRIVLSREAKLEDIRQIHENTNLEIEYFVQGALCVAFSGNCYLSSLEKGMSGNEGKCLQLCRLPYTNSLTNQTAYYLSARDLSLLSEMKTLIDAGVISFKIEGRMRHAGYTATVTNIYKSAINKLKLDEINNEWIEKQNILLKQTFSRGDFNKTAYLKNNTPDKIIYKDYQNHIGVEIGKVVSSKPFKTNLNIVKIQSNHPLSNGDGIKIIDKKSKTQVASLGIGDVKQVNDNIYEFVTKYKFRENLAVFLTQNAKSEAEFLSKTRKLDISLDIVANFGTQMKIEAFANINNQQFSHSYYSDFVLEQAQKSPVTTDEIITQFSKVSETNFNAINFNVNTNGVFVPKSIFNKIRRDFYENLADKIIEFYEKDNICKFNEQNYKKTISTNNSKMLNPQNIATVDESFDDFDKLTDFDKIVLKPSIYNESIIKTFFDKLSSKLGDSPASQKLCLNIPTIACFLDLEVIDKLLNNLSNSFQNLSLYINNIYGLYYADDYDIICSPLLNIKNVMAINHIIQLGSKTICASVEANTNFANNNNLVVFEKGKFPLMTFAHCPFKTIYDNKCDTCKYNSNLIYKNDALGSYKVSRTKIFNCYFELNGEINKNNAKFFAINFNK